METRPLKMVVSAVKVKIDLYYDVISPYSWIAFESLLRYQNIWPIQVNLKPFSLGTIMRSSGNKPPGLLSSKSLYVLKDLQRNNEFWEMKLSPPENFMKWVKTETSDNAMKLLLVIQNEQPRIVSSTRKICFIVKGLNVKSADLDFEGRGLNSKASLVKNWRLLLASSGSEFGWRESQFSIEKTLRSLISLNNEILTRFYVLTTSGVTDYSRLIEKLNADDVADQLQQNTSDALNSGAFGAPWIVVHKDGEEHAFFGSDRLHLIGHLIGHKFCGGLTQFAKL
ncbi:unnamed protein product [Angiostrongylus costaricensis]|uniref:Glutathione S-transferase kappa n=1 Tax=Angiostrongylus costaricensis TaxID=334426 RepID=A0A0R3PMF0_ANGCS|nr:unnamed protein product [Angiostrongylus costaricensis]